MLGFLLFIISFMLVFSSSYFLTSVIKTKNTANSLIYLSLILVSQIILSVEALSILKQINQTGLLISNLLIFIASFSLWKYKHYPQIDFSQIKSVKNTIILALKSDKSLLVLFLFFIIASLLSLFFTLVVPTNSSDSMAYHLARIGFWLQNQTLAHFETNSLRQLIFPVNSEIMILWPMVFIKKDFLVGFAEYFSYWGCIFVLYNFLKYLKLSTRRILWAIFILASLPATIIESSSTQTNLIVAFFLFCSLYLFLYGAKEKENKSLIFSAVAFSIALGVKSTATLFIPIFAIIYLLISIKESKKEFYKPIIVFILSSFPAFLLLSSYNYILNYIDFGSPFGPPYFVYKHSVLFGLKSFLASSIKYIFLFFSFTGIKFAYILSSLFSELKETIFQILHLQTTDGLVYGDLTNLNTTIHENYAMFGILGFLLILPLIIKYSLARIAFSKNRTFYLSLAGLITVGFLISISALMGFCYWYNRFFLTAIVLSSPILVLSYKRKNTFLKIFIVLVVLFNYAVISINNASKPLSWTYNALKTYDYNTFRNEARLRKDGVMNEKSQDYDLINYLGKTAPDNSNIGLILSCDDKYYPFFEKNSTWKIFSVRYKLLVKRNNYNDYDFLVISGNGQYTDIFEKNPLIYNYTLSGKDVVYNQSSPKEVITLYFDKDANPVHSKKPFIAFDVIKFEDIPDNFKLIKEFEPGNGYRFYIYKKIA